MKPTSLSDIKQRHEDLPSTMLYKLMMREFGIFLGLKSERAHGLLKGLVPFDDAVEDLRRQVKDAACANECWRKAQSIQ